MSKYIVLEWTVVNDEGKVVAFCNHIDDVIEVAQSCSIAQITSPEWDGYLTLSEEGGISAKHFVNIPEDAKLLIDFLT